MRTWTRKILDWCRKTQTVSALLCHPICISLKCILHKYRIHKIWILSSYNIVLYDPWIPIKYCNYCFDTECVISITFGSSNVHNKNMTIFSITKRYRYTTPFPLPKICSNVFAPFGIVLKALSINKSCLLPLRKWWNNTLERIALKCIVHLCEVNCELSIWAPSPNHT